MERAIVNALYRLERAGNASSKATQKLHAAAAAVAGEICRSVPPGSKLPRRYQVVRVISNVGSEIFLIRVQEDGSWEWIDGLGSYLHRDARCWIPPQTRAGSMQFAHDIAGGLLDEIAAWLEARAAVSQSAADALEKASSD